MKLFFAPLIAMTAIVLAAPGHAEPGVVEAGSVEASAAETPAFIAALHAVGISFADPAQAVEAGKAVCGLAESGETGLELLTDLRNANPALTINDAARFATIAAKSYCPQQLAAASKSTK